MDDYTNIYSVLKQSEQTIYARGTHKPNVTGQT